MEKNTYTYEKIKASHFQQLRGEKEDRERKKEEQGKVGEKAISEYLVPNLTLMKIVEVSPLKFRASTHVTSLSVEQISPF